MTKNVLHLAQVTGTGQQDYKHKTYILLELNKNHFRNHISLVKYRCLTGSDRVFEANSETPSSQLLPTVHNSPKEKTEEQKTEYAHSILLFFE